MESMRDINRIMEREIAKGSCPLKLEHIEFGDYSYQEIASSGKMNEVLSYLLRIGAFSQYAGKTIINNVYMDMKGKKPVFKRTKSAIERNNIFNSIKRYTRKLKPEYNVILTFRKKIWRSADIHIREQKHTLFLCRINTSWHYLRIV